MRRAVLAALVALPLLALPACSSGPSTGTTAPRSDPRMLSSADIEEASSQNMMNLYDLIASRRSQWLRPTTSTPGSRQPSVWMDNVRLGGVDQLRSVMLSVVVEARYLTPSEAQAQLGLNNLGGAILITTRRP